MNSKSQIGGPIVFHLQNRDHMTTENDFRAVQMEFGYMYKLTYHKFKKR